MGATSWRASIYRMGSTQTKMATRKEWPSQRDSVRLDQSALPERLRLNLVDDSKRNDLEAYVISYSGVRTPYCCVVQAA